MASRFSFPRLTSDLRVFTLTLLWTVTPCLYITRNHISLYNIDGSSMAPLLSPAFNSTGSYDIVLVRKDMQLSDDLTRAEGGSGTKGKLERGMVVLFPRPTSREPRYVVKRVVGLEGDEVLPLVRRRRYDAGGRSIGMEDGPLRGEIEAGHGSLSWARSLTRDKSGEKEPKAPYAGPSPPEAVKVPYGHVWVEGVNVDETVDSTEYGPISKSMIAGVATSVVWPPARRGDIAWKADWERSCKSRVKLAREEEKGVPPEWVM